VQSHNSPSIALIYDRLNIAHGGAEYLLKLFLKAFPKATLFTSVHHAQADFVPKNKVKTTFLQKLHLSRFHQWLAPLMPLAFENLDLSSFNVIISITSSEAKGILTKPDQLHLSYIFSPSKYLYEYQEKYTKKVNNFAFLLKKFFFLFQRYLIWWDKIAVLRPDKIYTISKLSANKIKKVYGLKTQVIYPPFKKINKPLVGNLDPLPQDFPPYLLVVSRLVEYKRVDLAIKITVLNKKKLLIVGEGINKRSLTKLYPQLTYVRSKNTDLRQALNEIKNKSIIFLGNCCDSECYFLYKKASAVLALGDDDFGLVPLEALNLKRPVIVSQNAGVYELIAKQKSVLSFHPKNSFVINQFLSHLPKEGSLDVNLQKKLEAQAFITTWQAIVKKEWQKYHNL